MVSKKKYFGTDGIRGRVGNYPITPDFVLKLGWAVGRIFVEKAKKENKICEAIIGKDTRISGYVLESSLQAGLLSAGANVRLLGPIPTPAIAYFSQTFNADVGIVISASHNYYYDNGIKFFSKKGYKITEETENYIEEILNIPIQTLPSEEFGKASRINDAIGRYVEFCKSTVPIGMSLAGLKIAIDCANGATYSVAPKVFRELGAELIEIGTEPDGININNESGSTSPQYLQAEVLKNRADLGIAFDGDGDRLVIIDSNGRVLDGDDIIYIITCYMLQQGKKLTKVVGTILTNLGLEKKLADMGIKLERVAVGDKNIINKMLTEDLKLGGEPSGHIICGEKSTTGDGIIASLQVLSYLVHNKLELVNISEEWERYPQETANIPLENGFVLTSTLHKKIVKNVEAKLGSKGRIIVRESGTEPLLRIMVESQNKHLNTQLVSEINSAVMQEINKSEN